MCKVHGDCGSHRERLAKKNRKTKNTPLKKSDKARNECCGNSSKYEPETELKTKSCYSLKEKAKKIQKRAGKNPCDVSQALSRIQPVYDERQQYLDAKHIICVLEKADIVKLITARKLSEKLAKIEFCNENKSGKKPKCTEAGKIKSNSRAITVKGKTKQVKRDMKTNKKIETLDEMNECSSLCSIDSDVDLEEFALTQHEIKKIKKNKKNANIEQDNVENKTEE